MKPVVRLRNGPLPYREALEARLVERGYEVYPSELGEADCTVVVARSEADWTEVADLVLWTPTLVVSETLEIESYTRALSLGAGAVHIDVSTSIIVDAIRATMSGEVILPLAIAQALAAHEPPQTHHVVDTPLTPIEERVAELMAQNLTIAQMASELSYSERTIRRYLQGIYLKFGVAGRKDAIRVFQERVDANTVVE